MSPKLKSLFPQQIYPNKSQQPGWEASGTGNMKFAINGALTIGTEDGANVEMREAVTDHWWPFRFGATAEQNAGTEHDQGREIYQHDAEIKRALDSFVDGTFATNDHEKWALSHLYHDLLNNDRFFVLRDLRSYYDTQKKVEKLYKKPSAWAETAIHNICAMGRFSSDESIHHYAKEIWGIEPCAPDPDLLYQIRKDYLECRIVTKPTLASSP